MRKVDLAYIAGIVDGEGTITIVRPQVRKSYSLQVSVANTNEWICHWLHLAFGGTYFTTAGQKPNHKELHHWALAARQAKSFLELILPYLKLKRPQAEIAIKFQARKKHRGSHHLPNECRVLEEADALLMGRLNKRGV